MTGHLITRPVAEGACPRCRRSVLTGYTGGLFVRVSATPLDEIAEVAALLAGRPTYDLITGLLPGHAALEWRCSIRISAARRYPVLTAHPCPGTGIIARPPRARPPARAPHEPPF